MGNHGLHRAIVAWIFLLTAFYLPQSGLSQVAQVVCSPIIGAQTTHAAKVWTMVKDCKNVTLEVGGHVHNFSTEGRASWKGNVPVTFEVSDIPADGALTAQLYLDGVAAGEAFQVKGASTEPKAEWSFMMGSCAFYGLGAMRAIKPGRHVGIFDAMLAQPTDFMLWLGDNVYLLNGEWNSLPRMYEKYTKVRLEPHTNAFLISRPQYAILDDHDYGPDNSESNFENKDMTMSCFRDFWPNPYFGDGAGQGTYFDFAYQDASFYMLDDRWFRVTESNQQVLGPTQMEWLQTRLKQSKSTFKFIALGSQVLSEANQHETWSRFPERQRLLDFIQAERISGVIFLSGDRHFAELCRLKQDGLYPLYDFTSSPISSIVRKKVNHPDDIEFNHSLRVEGTKAAQHNFGKVTILGPEGNRICRLECMDAYGNLLWRHEISQQELTW